MENWRCVYNCCCVTLQTRPSVFWWSAGSRSPRVIKISGVHVWTVNVYKLPQGERVLNFWHLFKKERDCPHTVKKGQTHAGNVFITVWHTCVMISIAFITLAVCWREISLLTCVICPWTCHMFIIISSKRVQRGLFPFFNIAPSVGNTKFMSFLSALFLLYSFLILFWPDHRSETALQSRLSLSKWVRWPNFRIGQSLLCPHWLLPFQN